MQIVTFALEEWMLFNVQHNIEVAGRSAVSPGFAQPGKTYPRTVFDTGRDFGVHRSLPQNAAFPFALQARIGNYASRALTRGTSTRHAEESLLVAHLATPSTGSTGNGSFAGSGARASALFASLVAPNRNAGFRAEHCLFEFQRDVLTQIGTTLGAAAPARTPAEEISEAEKVSEYLADILKDRGIESTRSRTAHGSMSKAVVCRPLVRVRQDGVGFAAFFEFLFGVRIIRIAIRMKLQRQFAIGALDLLIIGFAGNPKNFVVVAFYVAGQNSSKSFRVS